MPHQRKHRRVLYTLVVILAVLQLISFSILSIQISKIDTKITVETEASAEATKGYTDTQIEEYNSLYQQNFNDISTAIAQQQQSLEQEVKLLKSAQSDFSGVVQEAVKSVVTVTTSKSVGTGFIINQEGYVVTNYHVIQGNEDEVRVLTYDRKNLPAGFLGKDATRDLALLKIEGEYDYLEFADSDDLQVGKKVIAIGNPLGLSFTVTEGIISGLNREGPNGLEEYIQTDVSLNPGNSGGPLIDTFGKVIGINNFKIGDAESLGFALESNSIKTGINALVSESIV